MSFSSKIIHYRLLLQFTVNLRVGGGVDALLCNNFTQIRANVFEKNEKPLNYDTLRFQKI